MSQCAKARDFNPEPLMAKHTMTQASTLVFDLDGTLIDTAPDLVRATNHVLASLDLPAVSIDELKNWVGFGARRMIVAGLTHNAKRLPEPEIDRLLEDFLTFYASNIAIDSKPFPGAVAALERFASKGTTLAICTNKSEALAKQLMQELGLTDHFRVIAGRDTYPVQKPDPGHLTATIKDAGGAVDRAVMVGDSLTDIATAKAAKIPVVGVTHGYSDRPIADLGADALISHFDDLDCAIAGMSAFS